MKRLMMIVLPLLLASGLGAQTSLGIGGGKIIYGILDTVCEHSTDSYYVYVKNTGQNPFSGTLYLNFAVDSTGNFSWNYPLPDVVQVSPALAPGDSIPVVHNQTYDTSDAYRVGGNIVVIWPSGQNVTVSDSSRLTHVQVEYCNTVEEKADEVHAKIYPNPVHDRVAVEISGNKLKITAIGLYNCMGELLSVTYNSNNVLLGGYPEGIYFIRITFADGTAKAYKVIRRE